MCQILIVEDEHSIREIVEDFIRPLKFKFKSTSNAIEALLCLDKYKTIRICLIDLHLPGLDGLTLCRKIRCADPMMVCIAMTGFSTLFSLVECRQSGFDDILYKPFNYHIFKSVLLEYDARVNRWAKSK
jgi:two-component system phosphate regulon response regulator OmpR